MANYQVILVGAGLANGLIALRLRQQHPQCRILLIEAAGQPAGNHTWSFHGSDVSREQLAFLQPLISYQWAGYQVRFPERQRSLPGDYFSLESSRLAAILQQTFTDHLLTNSEVVTIEAQQVRLADGRHYQADWVIDGRGYQAHPAMHIGFQSFVGQVWQLRQPHGLTQPIIMDATVDQQGGYRFVYTLPLSERQLLIEDTHYLDNSVLDCEQARNNIADYAQRQGWQLDHLLREEQGALPITLMGDHRAWLDHRPLACSGLRAGLFHATTGYSLPQALDLADTLASLALNTSATALHLCIQQFSHRLWRNQRFFRMLNRMLFLAGPAEKRWRVMQRFYGLSRPLIARFYAGKLTVFDKLRILSGKPPVPVGAALKAVLTPYLRVKK